MEEKLIAYFKEKHNPLAIILHGSRAVGKEREHSDWDMVFIMPEPKKIGREIVFGQNCEGPTLVHPISDENLQKYLWSFRKGNAKVLFDTNGIGQEILDRAAQINANVPKLDQAQWRVWNIWFLGRIGSMKDYKDDPVAFMIKLGKIFELSVQLWFEKYKGTETPSVYDSLPMIQAEDSDYYNLLTTMASEASPEQKIIAAENVFKKIFD
jgi:hypothetical protein